MSVNLITRIPLSYKFHQCNYNNQGNATGNSYLYLRKEQLKYFFNKRVYKLKFTRKNHRNIR